MHGEYILINLFRFYLSCAYAPTPTIRSYVNRQYIKSKEPSSFRYFNSRASFATNSSKPKLTLFNIFVRAKKKRFFSLRCAQFIHGFIGRICVQLVLQDSFQFSHMCSLHRTLKTIVAFSHQGVPSVNAYFRAVISILVTRQWPHLSANQPTN